MAEFEWVGSSCVFPVGLPIVQAVLTASVLGYRGKILGTNISLNTPEDVQKWIAERKARWPTSERIKAKVGINDYTIYGMLSAYIFDA